MATWDRALLGGASDAVADARAEPAGFQLAAVDPAAEGLRAGADVAGDVGDAGAGPGALCPR
jgi:hypothetical protein